MRIVVCGDRNWTDKSVIKRFIEAYGATVVIHGGCRGADQLAGEVARELKLTVLEMPAEWSKYGLAAGPIRNQKMLDLNPDAVLAFHSDIQNSKGTKDMVTRAKDAGVPVRIISDPKTEWF